MNRFKHQRRNGVEGCASSAAGPEAAQHLSATDHEVSDGLRRLRAAIAFDVRQISPLRSGRDDDFGA